MFNEGQGWYLIFIYRPGHNSMTSIAEGIWNKELFTHKLSKETVEERKKEAEEFLRQEEREYCSEHAIVYFQEFTEN